MIDLFLLQSSTEGSTSQVSSYYQICYSFKKIEKFYLLKGSASLLKCDNRLLQLYK